MSTRDEKIESAPVKRVKNDEGKWNLVKKEDDSIISDMWFDGLGTWSQYSKDENIDIFGWDGLVWLEKPIKTGGAYPYSVLATVHHYSSKGKLLKTFESQCGIWTNK